MPQAAWYVHLQGETLGPLATEKVIQMLTQNRVQFADFAWREGFTKWARISDIDEFVAHLPGYPKIAIPAVPEALLPEPEAESAPAHAKAKKASPAARMASRFLRIPLSGKVIIVGHGNFEVLNIAERGVFVGAKEALEIGTELQFKLVAEALGDPLQMRGVVIRHEMDQNPAGFVIEFTRVNPIHKALIDQYVRKNSAQEA